MKVVTGILSTTHIDLHRDKMAKEALDDMAVQVNDHYIPLDVEHRGTYIGVILAAKVKPLKDGEHGLFGAIGIFDDPGEFQKYVYREENKVFKDYMHLLDEENK